MTNDTTKTCTKCGEDKLLSEFSRKSASGLRAWCKACDAASHLKYRADNPGKDAAYQRAYRAAHPEKVAAYLAANHETEAARNAAYRAAHPEKVAAYHRKWRTEHLEERAAHRRNRRARKKDNGGSHTAADIKALYALQEGRCRYCGVNVGNAYHVDHYIPLSKGGSNGPENLVIACAPCNLSKGDTHPDDFRAVGCSD